MMQEEAEKEKLKVAINLKKVTRTTLNKGKLETIRETAAEADSEENSKSDASDSAYSSSEVAKSSENESTERE